MTLQGKRVAVTRAAHQQEPFEEVLRAHGAIPVPMPTIEIVPVEGPLAIAAAEAADRARSGVYSAVLFTSVNAVSFYRLLAGEDPGGAFGGAQVFAIGLKTQSALQDWGLEEVTLAKSAVSEGLLTAVTEALGEGLSGTRILLPRALEGRDTVIRGLQGAGAKVDVIPLYETRPVAEAEPRAEPVDWVTFTSPSSVSGFVQHHELPTGCAVACIGPVTEAAAREAGLPVHVVATEQSIEGLAKAMDSAQI